MDRRSLVFVFILTICLFLFNQWYSGKTEDERQRYLLQKKKEQEQKVKADEEYVRGRTASMEEFDFVAVSGDEAGQNVLSMAFVNGKGSYLTMPWSKDVPNEVYIEGKKVPLEHASGLLVYSDGVPEVKTTRLPIVGRSDLQVVTFDGGKLDVTLGIYENNLISFLKGAPSVNGIAFYYRDGVFLPVGVYDAKAKRLKVLSEIGNLELAFVGSDFDGSSERLYAIENDYQQVVFSNVGGAIAQINLPFKTKSDKESVVRAIGIDRMIEKKYPSFAYFPNRPYETASGVKDPKFGGYYPLLRRSDKSPPEYYAMNLISDDPSLAKLEYKVVGIGEDYITFEGSQRNRKIVKTYRFAEDAPYTLECSIQVDGDNMGLWVASGVPEAELISGSAAPIMKYRTGVGSKGKVEKISLPKSTVTMHSIRPDWVATSNGYFGLILDQTKGEASGIKATMVPGDVDPTRLSLVNPEQYPDDKYPGYAAYLPVAGASTYRFFAGPLDSDILSAVDKQFGADYMGALSFHGWFAFISEPFAKFMFFLMTIFHSFTGSWGISIILLTVVLRLMMYPLNSWSMKSMSRMQEVAPKLDAIKKKYANNPDKLRLETMKLYKEKGGNPLSGCLPMLIQIPFIMGMFDLLKSTFQLRGTSFIPGWINNLSEPDVVFSWGYHIPFFGTSLHILPIILGILMFAQTKFSARANKGKKLTEQQQQQQKMGSFMTIGMSVLFYHFPSGLNIYWISSTSLGILQQWYMQKQKEKNACKLGQPS